MNKTEKSSKMLGNFLVDSLPILYQKSEKLLLIIQKTSISNYRSHANKCSCPKTFFWKSFLDTILQSRSLCSGWLFKWTWLCTINWSSNQVTQKHLQISREKLALTKQSHKLLLCSWTNFPMIVWLKEKSNLLFTEGPCLMRLLVLGKSWISQNSH